MDDSQEHTPISARGRHWRVRPGAGTASSKAILAGLKEGERALSAPQRLNDDLASLANLLGQRNFMARDAAQFLAPYDYTHFHTDVFPGLTRLDDLKPAITRLADAIQNHEKIGISSDYDCDGNTSLALMLRTLRYCGVDTETQVLAHIPNRKREGYGINKESVERMAAQGMQLLLTLDNGTVAQAPIAHAAEILGDDERAEKKNIIVVDHHPNSEGQPLPAGALVVNPHRSPAPTTDGARQAQIQSRDLAAVGLTYLLCQGVVDELQTRKWFSSQGLTAPNMRKELGLVALGLVADVVKLNSPLSRMMLKEGLNVINNSEDPALKKLCDAAGCEAGHITSETLAFRLGPIINASGRMADSLGWKILSLEPRRIERFTGLFDAAVLHNTDRKQKEAELLQKLEPLIVQRSQDDVLVLPIAQTGYEGVVGIVASRIMERTGKPVLVLSQLEKEDGTRLYVGSARSPKFERADGTADVCDMGEQLRHLQQEGVLLKGGGHPYAGGCSTTQEQLEPLREKLKAALGEKARTLRGQQATWIAGIIDPASLPVSTEIFKDAYLRQQAADAWIRKNPRNGELLHDWLGKFAGQPISQDYAGQFIGQPEKAFLSMLEQNIGRARDRALAALMTSEKRPESSVLVAGRIKALMRAIDTLAPYGEGNPKPLILFPNMAISDIDFMGKDKEGIPTNKHFRLHIHPQGDFSLQIQAVAYHAGNADLGDALLTAQRTHAPTHVLATLSTDRRGHMMLEIQDIMINPPSLERTLGHAGVASHAFASLDSARGRSASK